MTPALMVETPSNTVTTWTADTVPGGIGEPPDAIGRGEENPLDGSGDATRPVATGSDPAHIALSELVRGVNHVAVSVSDIAASIEFYRATFGLELLATQPAIE